MPIDDVFTRLTEVLLEWTGGNEIPLYILAALVVGYIMGCSRPFRSLRAFRASPASPYQNRGEALLTHELRKNFGSPDYHLMNHVTLEMDDGTTQIDHILVSRFGVFVIETKDHKGWIFADPRQAKWTQVLYHLKFKFQNPIFQNNRHVRAVQDCLDFLPPDAIESVVVFTGEAEFKTEVPQGSIGVSPRSWIIYADRILRSCPSIGCSSVSVGSKQRASPSAERRTLNTSGAWSADTAG